MIKPLLKVIPALSGNCKLSCVLNDYEKISNNEYIARSRYGHIFPLFSDSHQKLFDISFLNGSWEYDISKFYNSGYSDIFYKDTFDFDKNNILKYSTSGSVVKNNNSDIEFGCKRVSYIKTGKQLNFFAPIYCDNVSDLPDYFKINISLSNSIYDIKRTIIVDLTKGSKNYLNVYLTRYLSKIDDNVIYMLPSTKQAVYYGIDVWLGGFNTYKDNIISKIYSEETTINGYDACITDGFKRNNLIIRQILPLSFMFSIDDILTPEERKKYINSEFIISGQYYKDGKPLDFYLLDDNYEQLSLPVLKLNTNTGKLEYQYINNNLLALSENMCIRTDNAYEYRFSNKLNKTYNRWKLKYSPEEYPYITNTNFNFSKNQGLYNLYYSYPQNYYWTSLLCNIDNNEINLLLPIGKNNNDYYKESQYLVNKYVLSLNNYISNWFDITYSLNINDIVENTKWEDIHKYDNKVFYKGLLYNFNNIYKENIIKDKIDKFAILFYVDDSSLFNNSNINDIVYSENILENTQFNNVVSNITSLNNSIILTSSLYNIKTIDTDIKPNMTVNTNEYFSYNSYGVGKYVELEDLGIDFYESNKYLLYNEVTNILYKYLKYETYTDIISKIEKYAYNNGYELLPISYITNITNKNGLLLSNKEKIYISYNNINNKVQLNNYDEINTDTEENVNSYTFFQKDNFISSYYVKDIINYLNEIDTEHSTNTIHISTEHHDTYTISYYDSYETSNLWNTYYNNTTYIINNSTDSDTGITSYNIVYYNTYNSYSLSIDDFTKQYIYYPKYTLGTKSLFNIFVELDNHNKFYGNITSYTHIKDDANILYIDPYNIKEKLTNYYRLTGNIYIKDINEDYITLTDLNNDKEFFIYTSNENKQYILNLLDYKNTYIGSSYTKYRLPKYIKEINSLYLKKNVISNSVVSYDYSMKLVNGVYKKVETTSTNIINNTPIICYTYNFEYDSKFITNKVEFINNESINQSYIGSYLYVKNIDLLNNQLELTNYNNEFVYLVFDNNTELKHCAYNANSMIIYNDKYIPNQNGIGTYMYKESYIFNHPQNLISKITNLSYSTNDKLTVKKYIKTTYLVSYIGESLNPEDYIYTDSDYKYNSTYNIYTYNKYQDLKYSSEEYKQNSAYYKLSNKYDEKTNTYYFYWASSLDLYTSEDNYYNIESDCKFEICSYNSDINYSKYKLNYYNKGHLSTPTLLSNIMFLDDTAEYSYSLLYGRLLNNQHVNLFNKYLKQYALNISDKEYETGDNINDYIYIKRTVVDNNTLLDNVSIKDVFVPLSYYFGNTNVISYIYNIDDYLFKIDKDGFEENIELYFKKNFIKINKAIYDNVISINTNEYKDLYIYRILNNGDYIKDIKFTQGFDGYTRYNSSYSLVPLFDDVFYQHMYNTVIYKSYLLNNITEVNYIDEDRNTKLNLYRYNSKDKLYLVDVTNISDFENTDVYPFTQDKKSFIYDKEIISPIYAYSYASSKIPTYDKLTSLTSEFINITTNNDLYNKYKINTYTYNGVTYGFYLNKISLKNINNIFSIYFSNYADAKYFSKINGISIINNHKYLTDNFKLIIPILKYNILNNLYSIPVFNKQYNTTFKKRYINSTHNTTNHIIYDKDRTDSISLYRYYDNIVPNFVKGSNIYTEYYLKTTLLDKINYDTNIYREDSNIYNYKGIRIYTDNDNYEIKKQLEYKYYNDNKFVNLEPSFEIFIGNNLSELDIIKYQERDYIIKFFANYINKYKLKPFNDEEVLFLYNKYNIVLTSTSEKLDDKRTNKIYSLTYKFNLK